MQLEDYLGVVAGLTRAPVLVYTWSTSRSGARRSLAAGARGFMSKASSGVDLAAAVTALHRGETLSPPAGLAIGRDGTAELSTREAEVLELIRRG